MRLVAASDADRDDQDLDLAGAGCPRCGYDLRGAMASWRETCPLEGVCAECGLAFAWGDLLNARLSVPRWCIEAQRPHRAFPLQMIGTTWRLLWPAWLLRRLQMHHPIRPRRLAIHTGLLLLLLMAGVSVANGLQAWLFWHSLMVAPPGYSTASTASGLEVALQAALQPWSSRSAGRVTVTPTVVPAVVPVRIPVSSGGWSQIMAPASNFRYWWSEAAPLAVWLTVPIACALAFACLPISRRRAKVRWAHIARLTVYLYALLMPLVSVFAVGLVVAQSNLPQAEIVSMLLLIVAICWWPLLLLFWAEAAGSYLRMEHRWAVAISVVVIGILAPVSLVSTLVF